MRKKILAVALFILALTVVRVAFPEAVGKAKQALAPVTQYGAELARDMSAIGSRLTGDEGALYVWDKTEAPEESAEPAAVIAPEGFELEDMISSNLMGVPGLEGERFLPPEAENPLESDYLPSLEPPAEAEAEAEIAAAALQTKLDEFLAAQAAVTSLALPESVCTEAVMLDFEYCPPVGIDYTSAFGYRLHPIYGDIRFHYGTDFPANSGDAIGAFSAGTVIAAQELDGYGLTVIIDHGNGFTSLYAHCSRLMVSLGDAVDMGQTIALVGATGNVTGPHLHLELKSGDKYLNPEFYL